ncbi:hypothetical protein NPIL_609101 [Nephila pilipes]|uniref:Reverse transcriptase RNase H-like domain-containing protein n=1 Tax=Nephila pilipes TaxID=299642 RepID=A0A8X6MN13_NEPPI|nr:hypothetical protein NPIL_609101 [Nephila pilipes]
MIVTQHFKSAKKLYQKEHFWLIITRKLGFRYTLTLQILLFGSVLRQFVDGVTSHLVFFYRKLSPAECLYSAYDLELLTEYSSVRSFRHIVEGRTFCICTDSKQYAYSKIIMLAIPKKLSFSSSEISPPQVNT